MRGFEELWEEAGGGICGKRACEKFYRAALEEILSQLKRPIYSADIMKWIEKELEGGD